ncbi:MAG TPA: glycosyltransferase family 4 protein, partial [Thermoanaerobaculia bacterium]|jgi:glycosyltransferase involved in cell wall biosynthesis
MKVLFVYKYLTLGGVEAVLRARLDGLDRTEIEAYAWFFHDYGGRSIFRGQEDRVRVGPVEDCLRWARQESFDLLCSIDSEEILPGFAGAPAPPRLVIECHSAYLANIEYLRRLAACRPAAVFTPSEAQRRLVRERVGKGVEVRVVPNPLRREFVAEPAAFPAPPPRPVVAWIGRLDEQKNWQDFVRIAGLLGRRGIVSEAWIIGKPIEADGTVQLLERARAEGALGRLRWFGALPHGRIPAFLDAVRDSGGVVVSTSRGESFGLTVAEAMARRCAVVAPDQGPFTEFVEEGVTGSLFAPGSVESAASRTGELLARADLRERLGRQAREAVLARFAPEPALVVLAHELRRLMSGKSTR